MVKVIAKKKHMQHRKVFITRITIICLQKIFNSLIDTTKT